MYFQSSSIEQKNNIRSEVAKIQYYCMSELQLNLQKHVNMCYSSFKKM